MGKLPSCFGTIEVRRPQSRAENGCDDCPHETQCAKHTNTSRSGDLVKAVERYVRVFTSGASDAVKYRAHTNLLVCIEAIETIEAENKQLRREGMRDHARGCEGRNYLCTCGYDDATADRTEALEAKNERLTARVAELEGLLREAEVKLIDAQGKQVSKRYASNLLPRIRAALETKHDGTM